MSIEEDYFGFLPVKQTFKVNDFRIEPLEDFDESISWIKQLPNRENFCYPPKDTRTHLWSLPASHKIIYLTSIQDLRESRLQITGFIMNLLAYLFGIRLQFHDWWFDMRLPMRNTSYCDVTDQDVERFINRALEMWDQWNRSDRIHFKNILFMHSRNTSYLWEWEQFYMEYSVFDALYKFVFGRDRTKHRKRFNKILTHFNMWQNQTCLDDFIYLRNMLVHETLWDGAQPGSEVSQRALYAYYYLKQLNHRLIAAIIGFETTYISTKWLGIGHSFLGGTHSKGRIISMAPVFKD